MNLKLFRPIFLSIFLLLLGTSASEFSLYGQTQPVNVIPECTIPFTFTAAGSQPATATANSVGDNRSIGCNNWTLDYQSTGFSALTLTFQSATGAVTAGAFGTYSGTVSSGINPNTSTTGAQSTFTGYVGWFRVTLGGLTGSGTVRGILYGYRTGSTNGGGGGGASGCAGTVATPCVVDGPDAVAAASTKPPVQIAGNDGSLVRAIKTDTAGQGIPSNASNALADGVSNTELVKTGAGAAILYDLPFPYIFNGTTWDKQFDCTSRSAFNVAAGTDVVMATGVSAQTIKVCHVSFSGDTTATMTIQQGTGVTCGSNTAALTGGYVNVLGFAFDFTPLAALRTTVAARDVCLHLSAAATGGGVIIYASY